MSEIIIFEDPGNLQSDNSSIIIDTNNSQDLVNVTRTTKNVGGRKRSAIYLNFTQEEEEGAKGKVVTVQVCNLCSDKVSNRPQRMESHYARCLAKKSKEDNSLLESQPQLQNIRIVSVSKTPSKEELDNKLAKFWFSSNLPFQTVQSKYFLDLVHSLNPDYKPPCDKTLKGTLLDNIYEELQDSLKDDVNGALACLVQDGWSDAHNHPILTHTLVAGGKAYLLNVIECQDKSKTAIYCAKQFEEAIDEATKLGAIVVGATTDNCNTMVATRNRLKKSHPHLFFYGDTPHMLNKLLEDLTPKDVSSKVVEVNKVFRNHHRPTALLAEMNGLKPQVPCATRWSTHKGCIKTFLENRSKYVAISEKSGVLSNEIIKIVNDIDIFKQAESLYKIFDEIDIEMVKCQSDERNISDALHSWLTLLNSDNLKGSKVFIEKRMNQCIEDFFYVAYLLHPKYKGELLSQAQKDKAHDFLLNKSPDYLVSAIAFSQKDSKMFPKAFFDTEVMEKTNPASWWLSMKSRTGIPDGLVDMLVKLYNCPASTSSVERIFSTFGFIQSDTRSSLSQEKITKLSFVFRALRSQDRK